jgi:hypothetical protein
MTETQTFPGEKLLVVAKQIWDNLPMTNKNFIPESVNDAAHRLQILLKKEHISQAWIDSVYAAAENNQPIFIDVNNEWQWHFLTMKSGTKEQLLDQIRALDPKKMRFKK